VIHQIQVSGFKFASQSATSLRQLSYSAWADISKAKRLLGWPPQTNPEDGFRKTVEWNVANRGT
jgi:nucleoside-diphosphate-sugar epimerase